MNNTRNILFVSNQSNFNGGASRSVLELIQNLDRSRYIPFFASRYEGEVTEKIRKLGVITVKLHPRKFTPPFFDIASVPLLTRFMLHNKIHLIHNNQCDDALYSWIPAKITRTPIIIHHRDPSFYKRNRFLSNHVDANIAMSSWQNDINLSKKGVVIPDGIEIRNFQTATNCKNTFLKHEDGKILVGLLGRIMPYKAQDMFLRAAALALKKNTNIHFFIIGDDNDNRSIDYIRSLKILIDNLKIKEYVTFTGYIPESFQVLPELDISVVPSRKEIFGRVIIESMACAKPVIATNVWGAMDIVTEEVGMLVPPDDPQFLSTAILQLVVSPQKRKSMGEAGRKRAEALYTIEAMMKKIYQLYENILAKRMIAEKE